MLTFTLPELRENKSVFSNSSLLLCPMITKVLWGNLLEKVSKFINELIWPTNLSKRL